MTRSFITKTKGTKSVRIRPRTNAYSAVPFEDRRGKNLSLNGETQTVDLRTDMKQQISHIIQRILSLLSEDVLRTVFTVEQT